MLNLKIGTEVRVTMVDSYAFTGRDRHPEKNDVGFRGVIAGRHPDEDDTAAYVVCAPTGRVLDLVEYEIEPVDEALTFRVWEQVPSAPPQRRLAGEGLTFMQASQVAEDAGSYLSPIVEQE